MTVFAALSAANGAFLVLDAGGLLGSGLVDHPLEAVCCRVGLIAALALMPVVGVIILPSRTITMGMRICRGYHRQLRFDPKALRVAVIAYASVVYFLAVDFQRGIGEMSAV